MHWIRIQRIGMVVLLPALLAGVAGCGALDVTDPTQIEENDLDNSGGADLLRKDALHALADAIGRGVLTSGMLADEFLWDANPLFGTSAEEMLDRRDSRQYEELAGAGSSSGYGRWHEARRAVGLAIPRIRSYMREHARSAYLGQMFAARAFATLNLAEHFCPGFPLHDVVDDKLVIGSPLTTPEAFEHALADFDSAVGLAEDSTRFLHLAQVGRARSLLGLGRFAEAGEAAASVPTTYVWNGEFSPSTGPTHLLNFPWSATSHRKSVADHEGGNGLDFISANDDRVQVTLLGPAYDDVTGIYVSSKYASNAEPIVLASGIEARLIEAEAALREGRPEWIAILNDLRATQITPALEALNDSGSDRARVDLLFRERAFWLFATGHRLGDLRRLVERYGRGPDTAFPAGEYRVSGMYDTATSIPFPTALEMAHNSDVAGCTSR